MHGTMSMEVLKQRREEMLREAESHRLKRALRAERGRSAASRLASTVAWELMRASGLLYKLFRTPKNHNQK